MPEVMQITTPTETLKDILSVFTCLKRLAEEAIVTEREYTHYAMSLAGN